MSSEIKSPIVIVDREHIIPNLGGSFKGLDFVRYCEEPKTNGGPVYVLRANNSGKKCIVLNHGEVVAQIPLQITDFPRGLKAKIAKLERDNGASSEKIILPILQRKRDGSLITDLQQELRFFDTMVQWRLQSIKFKENEKSQAILNILLASSEKGISISSDQLNRWKSVIEQCVCEKRPITLTMSLAVGTRIPNRLKFFDDVNLPTYGWMYFLFFFKLLNEKIRTVYLPGIKLVIFDEAWLFGRYLGVSQPEIEVNLEAVKKLITLMNLPAEIVLMKENHFDIDEVNKVKVRVNEAQVYGFLCSLPEMNNPCVMHPLYRERRKNYQKIKLMAGELWDEAYRKSMRVAQYLFWRKQSNLFGRLIGESYIDTTITDKDERLVLDITCSLMNHGMPVVRCNTMGLLKVDIVPEYRIPGEYPQVAPVWIKKSDFIQGAEGSFKFYYLEV